MTTSTIEKTAAATVRAWHFLTDDGRMQFGDREQVWPLTTYTISTAGRRLRLCEWGLHGSERALDALSYAPGSRVCRVELSGEILRDTDKLCATERRVLWMGDATSALHEFSAWAADWILDRLEAKGYKIDSRSRAAPAAKRTWLRGEISDKQLAAAWAAAGDAAWAATGHAARAAARAAAWAATGAATGHAAWAATGAAARAAARAATGAATGAELNQKLTEMLEALAPQEVTS